MLGPATSKLMSVIATVLLITVMAVAVLVPQAQAAFPGRNGALLLHGKTRKVACSTGPPRVVGRLADEEPIDPRCAAAPPVPEGWFVLAPGERTLRRLSLTLPNGRWRLRSLSYWVSPDCDERGRCVFSPPPIGSFDSTGTRLDSVEAWSPGGTRTIDWTATNRGRVVVRNRVTGRAIAVRAGSSPDWSIGNEIAYERSDALWVMQGDGSKPRRVPLPSTNTVVQSPEWSPDGKWIAFIGGELDPDEIMAVRPDGSGLRHLTPALNVGLHNPLWSPDGSLIAFQTSTSVWVMSALSTAPAGPHAWKRLARDAELLDWQALPPSRSER